MVSTHNHDGSIHSAVVWVDTDEGAVAINSAVGRRWPANLVRDPRVTIVVYESGNPYNYVEIRGTAHATRDGAGEHIDRLSKKYTGRETFEGGRPDEERIKFLITPERLRYYAE